MSFEALVIGTSGQVNDAVEMVAFLKEQRFNKVSALVDDINETKKLDCRFGVSDRYNVLCQLALLAQSSSGYKHDDVVVIYFAGKGGIAESAGRQWRFWQLNNGTRVYECEIIDAIAEINAKRTFNVTLFVDACYVGLTEPCESGTRRVIDNNPKSLSGRDYEQICAAEKATLQREAKLHYVWLSACKFDPNQGAFEVNGRGHFTAALKKAVLEVRNYGATVLRSGLSSFQLLAESTRAHIGDANQVPSLVCDEFCPAVFSQQIPLSHLQTKHFSFDHERMIICAGVLDGVTTGSRYLVTSHPEPTIRAIAYEVIVDSVSDNESHVHVHRRGEFKVLPRASLFARCVQVPESQRGVVFVTPEAQTVGFVDKLIGHLRSIPLLRVVTSPPLGNAAHIFLIVRVIDDQVTVVGKLDDNNYHSLLPPFPILSQNQSGAERTYADNILNLYHYRRKMALRAPTLLMVESAFETPISPLDYVQVTAEKQQVETSFERDFGVIINIRNSSSVGVYFISVCFNADGSVIADERNFGLGPGAEYKMQRLVNPLKKLYLSDAESRFMFKVFVSTDHKFRIKTLDSKAFEKVPTIGKIMGGPDRVDVMVDKNVVTWRVFDIPITLLYRPKDITKANQSVFFGSPSDI